jgi:hypothetical protein
VIDTPRPELQKPLLFDLNGKPTSEVLLASIVIFSTLIAVNTPLIANRP